jgi:hypothetical protein
VPSSAEIHGHLGKKQFPSSISYHFISCYSEEALTQFRQSPFFASWDPAVLKVYVKCGLTDDGRGGVKLKTSAINEAVVFADNYTAFETYDRLEELDPKVALRWVMPGVLGSR